MIGRTARVLALSASTLVSVSAPLRAQEIRVEGRVVDEVTGRGIEGAVVWSTATPTPRSMATDAEGRFALCRLPEGDVPLQVSSTGFARLDTTVRAAGGGAREVRISLRRLQAGEPLTWRHDRGRSLPLHRAVFVVDGVRIFFSPSGCGDPPPGMATVDSIDPDDIERVEIVRGPAAAERYGSDAAHGVVVVTTRRGASPEP